MLRDLRYAHAGEVLAKVRSRGHDPDALRVGGPQELEALLDAARTIVDFGKSVHVEIDHARKASLGRTSRAPSRFLCQSAAAPPSLKCRGERTETSKAQQSQSFRARAMSS